MYAAFSAKPFALPRMRIQTSDVKQGQLTLTLQCRPTGETVRTVMSAAPGFMPIITGTWTIFRAVASVCIWQSRCDAFDA
jgi:hypothetical protein